MAAAVQRFTALFLFFFRSGHLPSRTPSDLERATEHVHVPVVQSYIHMSRPFWASVRVRVCVSEKMFLLHVCVCHPSGLQIGRAPHLAIMLTDGSLMNHEATRR